MTELLDLKHRSMVACTALQLFQMTWLTAGRSSLEENSWASLRNPAQCSSGATCLDFAGALVGCKQFGDPVNDRGAVPSFGHPRPAGFKNDRPSSFKSRVRTKTNPRNWNPRKPHHDLPSARQRGCGVALRAPDYVSVFLKAL